MPNMAMKKWKFSEPEALNATTTIHANPTFFGEVMAMTRPKHAVAYHFQNDFDTLPATIRTVERVYDGPVDYATDFMVWNITKDGVRTRMADPGVRRRASILHGSTSLSWWSREPISSSLVSIHESSFPKPSKTDEVI